MRPSIVLVLATCATQACSALLLRSSLRAAPVQQTRAHAISMIEMGTADGELPPNVASRLSFQTGGYKTATQEEEFKILWNTFKQCYPTEALAVAALEKNTAVLTPQLNSPTKIIGTYELLLERFGEEEALVVITKNPGILCCTPQSLSSQSNDDIMVC